jgi:DNA-binding SARP family transcriptional activator
MRLTLSLHGPFRAWLDDAELALASRRGRAILAMLALSGTGAVARDR